MFKMPTPTTIKGRSSSLTNAFVNGIIPCIKPSQAEICTALCALKQCKGNATCTLGQCDGKCICASSVNVKCVYCGDNATEWDHLNPLIKNQKPTGYISEIHNLVPSCSKCNQSKGNADWCVWMNGNAKQSPTTRNKTEPQINVQTNISIITAYAIKFPPKILNLAVLDMTPLWIQHWANHKALLGILACMQTTSTQLKTALKNGPFLTPGGAPPNPCVQPPGSE
jgi:hypothetical protein